MLNLGLADLTNDENTDGDLSYLLSLPSTNLQLLANVTSSNADPVDNCKTVGFIVDGGMALYRVTIATPELASH